jgi:hypothetical protein
LAAAVSPSRGNDKTAQTTTTEAQFTEKNGSNTRGAVGIASPLGDSGSIAPILSRRLLAEASVDTGRHGVLKKWEEQKQQMWGKGGE